jgi:hypothetical protein
MKGVRPSTLRDHADINTADGMHIQHSKVTGSNFSLVAPPIMRSCIAVLTDLENTEMRQQVMPKPEKCNSPLVETTQPVTVMSVGTKILQLKGMPNKTTTAIVATGEVAPTISVKAAELKTKAKLLEAMETAKQDAMGMIISQNSLLVGTP